MDKATALNTAMQYANAVKRQLNPQAIVLYGSFAKDTNNEDSDIDVAVIFDDYTGDFLETSSLLWKLRRNISDDIEPILLDSTKDKSGFVNEVLKTGHIIYSINKIS